MNKFTIMYNDFKFLPSILVLDPSEIKKVKRSDVVNQNEVLLDSIFAVDPRTGFPTSDITAFLSDKVSPEVKMFIQSQLLKPNRSVGSSSDLDEDTIAMLSRGHNESLEIYKDRLMDFINSQDSAEN